MHFNVAFIDLAALTAWRSDFAHFHLSEVTIRVGIGDEMTSPSGVPFDTWTPNWLDGEVAAASLSATVLVPDDVR